MSVKDTINQIKDLKKNFEGRERIKALSKLMDQSVAMGGDENFIVAAVCGIHILIEHGKSGVLIDRDYNALVKTVADQLTVVENLGIAGVDQLVSSFHLAKGRVASRQGRHWEAGFENLSGFSLKGTKNLGGVGNKKYSIAVTAMRLGFGDMAIAELRRSLANPNPSFREKISLRLIRALRICGHFSEALSMIKECDEASENSDEVSLDLHWEKLCIESAQSGRFAPLVNAGSKKGSHNKSSYILEAKLWAWALGDRVLEKINGKLRYLGNNDELKLKDQGFIYRAVLALEQSHDDEIPLANRIQKICFCIQEAPSFAAIDQEQIFLIGSSRWFVKHKFYDHARFCVLQYRKHSWGLTNSLNDDNLGICSDIYKSKWFTNLTAR